MNPRGLAALVLLLGATSLERLAFYGSRSFLVIDLRDGGASVEQIGTAVAVSVGGTLVGTILGGIAAFAAGSWAVVVGSVLFVAAGHGALAAGAPLLTATMIGALGAGMFRLASFAAAADLLARDDDSPAPPGPHRFAAVAAFAMLSSAATNLGSGVGPTVAGVLRSSSGAAAAHRASLTVAIAAMVIGILAALTGRRDRRTAEEKPLTGPYRAAAPRAEGASTPVKTALAGLGLLFVAEAFRTLGDAMVTVPNALLARQEHLWVYGISPLMAFFASLAVFAVLAIAARKRATWPPLLLTGGGLAISAIGFLAIAVANGGVVSLHALGAALAGIGEAPMHGVLLAYAALALRGRAAPLALAGWMAVAMLARAGIDTLGMFPGIHAPVLGLAAIGCLSAGAALFVYARKIHFRFFDAPTPPSSP